MNNDKANEPIHIISLGAGVQSSTMALMAAHGEITPIPVAAVFADTCAEPNAVYLWLDYLKSVLPFPVITVQKGDLKEVALTIRKRKDGTGTWAKTVIPSYILNKDGSCGIVQRQCTYDFKVMPLIKESKRLIKEFKASSAVQWIGISVDEVQRMKDSREKLITHRWPLVDLRMSRQDCLRWMERNGYSRPPRSACVFCPYHSDAEWRRLKTDAPTEFADAVQFERDLQHVKRQTDNMKGIPFLHNSLRPLSKVDFSTEEERGQLNMFNNECEGMCGV
jgi:hypothetical protein